MHAIVFLKHSAAGDEELRFALRGIADNCPFIEKVWIFGDRPLWLSNNTRLIEHVPHLLVARIGSFKLPVTNGFLLTWLSSLIPELSSEYLLFSDDQIVLQPLADADARAMRYLEDMSQVKNRGQGLWLDSLWRTYDTLKRLGLPGYNFETHCPTFYTKRRVLEAYCNLKDYVTEDRWYGLLAHTAILNHALVRERCPLVHLATEGKHVGFHYRAFQYEDISTACAGKTFLNFDDIAFDDNMRHYLRERFPEPCKYERGGSSVIATKAG